MFLEDRGRRDGDPGLEGTEVVRVILGRDVFLEMEG